MTANRLDFRGSATWRAWLVAVCVLMPLIVFGLLAEDVTTRSTIRFDAPLLLGLHAHASPFFNAVMLFLSWLGGLLVLAFSGVLVIVLAWQKQRIQAAFLLWAMVGTSLLNVAMKAAFQRTRPDLWLSLAPERDYGFPSGHSMLSSAFVLALLVLLWKSDLLSNWKWVFTCFGVAFMMGVGLSRLYLGVHYPSDVLAGFALSASWIALLQGIFQKRLVDRVLL